MLTKIRCCKESNDQFINLDDISSIQVSDTDYCAGWLANVGKYSAVTLSMKNGHIIELTIENDKLKALTEV